MKTFKWNGWVLIPTLLVVLFYFSLPLIENWITSKPVYAKYEARVGPSMVRSIQSSLLYPFGKHLSAVWRNLLIFPYWLLIFFLLQQLYLAIRPIQKWLVLGFAGLLLLLYIFPDTLLLFDNAKPSKTIGSVSNGEVHHAKRVPMRGENYHTYSFGCYLLGRTYAHDRVKNTILDAYEACETSCPETEFVLGEIGFRKGGRFIPHITHQNGMSVDFMTPLLKNNRPYTNYHLFNLWGYTLEFDKKGKDGKVEIDYESMAKHLIALEKAAKANGLRIQKVIFDPVLRPHLLKTASGKKIRHLPYTKNRVIIRHDDHYHIDFSVR